MFHISKLGFVWSWKRAVGITREKAQLARKTGIPMSHEGLERRIGRDVLKVVTFGGK